jgi:hypothetical protein
MDDVYNQKSLRNDFLTHFLAIFAVTMVAMVALSFTVDSELTLIGRGAFIGIAVTLLREGYDHIWGNGAQWSDIAAGFLGIGFAVICVLFL